LPLLPGSISLEFGYTTMLRDTVAASAAGFAASAISGCIRHADGRDTGNQQPVGSFQSDVAAISRIASASASSHSSNLISPGIAS
jgi:hypothetical protein